MEIRICALRELKSACAAFLPDAVISIGEESERSEARAMLRNVPEHKILRLEFADIEHDIGEHRAPAEIDLLRVETHLKLNIRSTEGRVLVHCSAGLSRSPAVALYCLYWNEMHLPQARNSGPERLWARIKAAAPYALPHSGILRMTEERYHLGGGAAGGPLTRCYERDRAEGLKRMAARKRADGTFSLW